MQNLDTWLPVRIGAMRDLTPSIRELRIDGAPPATCTPGAHVNVRVLIGGRPGHRSYSVTRQLPDGSLFIAVKRAPQSRGGSVYMWSLEVGSLLQITPPACDFALHYGPGPYLLIAGGIGITPIYAMLRSLVRRHRDFAFVYSGRTAEQLAYREEAMQLAGARGLLHLSGADGANLLDLRALLAAQGADTTVYVCGPTGMVDATHRAAAELGWPAERVRSEFFGVAASQDDVAFDVHLAKSGRCISVGKNTSILDALTSAGVDLMYDCRRGECGLCPLTVLAADGPIAHRDRYLSDEERAAGKTLCLCVSRIQGSSLTLDA